jgi:hypothetical protein
MQMARWFVFHGYPTFYRTDPITREEARYLMRTVDHPMFMQRAGRWQCRLYPSDSVVAPWHHLLGWLGIGKLLVGPKYFRKRHKKAMTLPPSKLGLKPLDKKDRAR